MYYTIIVLTKDNVVVMLNPENKIVQEIHRLPNTIELNETHIHLKFEGREISIKKEFLKRLIIRFSK